jgi:hypothetical protein
MGAVRRWYRKDEENKAKTTAEERGWVCWRVLDIKRKGKKVVSFYIGDTEPTRRRSCTFIRTWRKL